MHSPTGSGIGWQVRVGLASNAARIWILIMCLVTCDYTPMRAGIHLQPLVYPSLYARFSRRLGHGGCLDFINQLSLIYAIFVVAYMMISLCGSEKLQKLMNAGENNF